MYCCKDCVHSEWFTAKQLDTHGGGKPGHLARPRYLQHMVPTRQNTTRDADVQEHSRQARTLQDRRPLRRSAPAQIGSMPRNRIAACTTKTPSCSSFADTTLAAWWAAKQATACARFQAGYGAMRSARPVDHRWVRPHPAGAGRLEAEIACVTCVTHMLGTPAKAARLDSTVCLIDEARSL